MKIRFVTYLSILMLLGFTSACVSKRISSDEKGPGRWVTLPPETGSLIPRKVWVREEGKINNVPGIGNVQVQSGAGLEHFQRNNPGFKRPGGN